MIKIRIYWQDLTPEMQEKLISVMGDNCNWDCFPIATLEIEDEKDAVIDSFLGDRKITMKEEMSI